jgi:hypothetical protein
VIDNLFTPLTIQPYLIYIEASVEKLNLQHGLMGVLRVEHAIPESFIMTFILHHWPMVIPLPDVEIVNLQLGYW